MLDKSFNEPRVQNPKFAIFSQNWLTLIGTSQNVDKKSDRLIEINFYPS